MLRDVEAVKCFEKYRWAFLVFESSDDGLVVFLNRGLKEANPRWIVYESDAGRARILISELGLSRPWPTVSGSLGRKSQQKTHREPLRATEKLRQATKSHSEPLEKNSEKPQRATKSHDEPLRATEKLRKTTKSHDEPLRAKRNSEKPEKSHDEPLLEKKASHHRHLVIGQGPVSWDWKVVGGSRLPRSVVQRKGRLRTP